MNGPQIIILSSSEGYQIANVIRMLISDKPDLQCLGVVCDLWKEVFAGENMVSALDVLEKAYRKYNFAIVLFTQDDLTESRGEEKPSPRDNLVFELGLSVSALGRERTLLLIEGGKIKIPSDLHGVMPEKFDLPPKKVDTRLHDPDELRQRLGAVCSKIAMKIQGIDWNRPSTSGYPQTLSRLRDHWQQYPKDHSDFKLFTFCGISEGIGPDSWDADTHLEQIYHLWANAAKGSWIHAAMISDEDLKEQRIRITFANKDEYPGNVAIRFAGQGLIRTSDGKPFKTLRFKYRIPPGYRELFNQEKPMNLTAEPLSEVGLNIRVIDALMTHWEYCCRNVPGEYLIMSAKEGEDWNEWAINLKNHKCWFAFRSDGNYLYHSGTPDFSQILAMVVEVGGRAATRAGKGVGVVELKEFKAEN